MPQKRPRHATAIGLVFVGGTAGTFARYAVTLAVPSWGSIPVGIFVVNIVGAFLLGLLLTALPGAGRARLLLGTGVLGGFTTYSAFALDAVATADLGVTVLYGLATVLIGALATFGGVVLGARWRR